MVEKRKPPKVRLESPANRPIQAVYKCPIEERFIRLSTGTYDEAEAEEFRRDVEAKLRVGISPRSTRTRSGASMPWETFRERYSTGHLANNRAKAAIDAESRIDVAEVLH